MNNPALTVYAENAEKLVKMWADNYQPAELYAPIADLLPPPPCRIADIGAGPGREAAWLAGQGYDLLAVEPVEELRNLASPDAGLTWLADHLPDLSLLRREVSFDLLLLTGVWHHVTPADRQQAMESLVATLKPGGSVIMSLRHGRTDEARGLFAVETDETVRMAQAAGLERVAQREVGSIQAHNRQAGVHWTWLKLRRSAGAAINV